MPKPAGIHFGVFCELAVACRVVDGATGGIADAGAPAVTSLGKDGVGTGGVESGIGCVSFMCEL